MKKILFLMMALIIAVGGYNVYSYLSKTTTKQTTASTPIKNTTTSKLLPLGDDKISTSAKKGYIFACGSHKDMQGGGAGVDGPWIGSGVRDPSKKITVTGNIYRSGTFKIVNSGVNRIIMGNGLPVDYPTGIYPIKSTDPAYKYDRNPNKITSYTMYASIPKSPVIAKSPTCLGGEGVGITLEGVVIFDGLDALGRDAVAHEVQDKCSGHPEKNGTYHYHSMSNCFKDSTGSSQSTLIGYARDGFGIYGPKGPNGKVYTNADLDECHGITSEVMRDGKKVTMYHYVATAEYPYTVGCFKGTPTKTNSQKNDQTGQQNSNGKNQTNSNTQAQQKGPEDACINKKVGDSCSFVGIHNEAISSTCRTTPNSQLVCGGPKQ